MKRSPLQRRTPMRQRTSRLGANTPERPADTRPPAAPMDLGAAALALSRQQASADAPRRDHTPVPDPVRPKREGGDGSFAPQVRAQIIDRDRRRCQRCGRHLGEGEGNIQHRVNRGAGGTHDPVIASVANGLLLCGSGTTGCHGNVEAHPEAAERHGFAVASWAHPATVPVLTFEGWRQLDMHGSRTHCPTPLNSDAHSYAVRRSATITDRKK